MKEYIDIFRYCWKLFSLPFRDTEFFQMFFDLGGRNHVTACTIYCWMLFSSPVIENESCMGKVK